MKKRALSQNEFTSEKINRNKLIQWAVTFPQYKRCAATTSEGRDTYAEILTKKTFANFFPPNHYVCCCEETHEDGGLHLHMGIKLKKGLSKTGLMNYMKVKFPNDHERIKYKVITRWPGWIDYCKKEDPSVHIDGSLSNNLREKKMEIDKEIDMKLANHFHNKFLAEKEREKNQRDHEENLKIFNKMMREREIQEAFDEWSMDTCRSGNSPFKF